MGFEDAWFTGDPQQTFFNTRIVERPNRKRESFEIPFDNPNTQFGTTDQCTIIPKGDYLTGLTLRVQLPAIYTTQAGEYVYPKPSSELGGNVYVNLDLTLAVADGTTLTANTTGNHYLSVGAKVTLAGAKTYTITGILIYDLDGTYTISGIPTANSFTCTTTKAGVATSGTVSSLGLTCADVVSYFSTQNSNLWVDNLTNKTWKITAGSNVGTSWTFTTSEPSKFPVGSQVVINLPSSGVVNQVFTVTASADNTFTITKSYSLFFAFDGVNQIQSTDLGLTWKTVSPSSAGGVYGNGVWVGTNIRSVDNGITWNAIPSPLAGNWYGVGYGNGIFVMVGLFTNWQARSVDNGLTWQAVATPLTSNVAVGPIAYGNGNFVCVSQNTQMYSTNLGVSWSNVATSLDGLWNDIAYGNSVFVMVGGLVTYSGITAPTIARSTDFGLSWSPITSPVATGLMGVAYGNGVFVSVGSGVQIRSTDYGLSWTSVASPLAGNWTSVTYGNGVFVMVGNDNTIAYSTDLGQTWNYSSSPVFGTWGSIRYGIFNYTDSSSDSVSLVTPPLQLSNRTFSSNGYTSISFANADDAAFWGFDAREGLIYNIPATPPWTYTQGGWISGFLPPSLSTYVDSVAHKLVKSGRILIGKQTIKEFSGEYIELQNDLWVPYENKAILKLLNGTFDQTQAVANREYYVRIPMGLHEIPLCALKQQSVSIEVDFERYSVLSDNLNQGNGQFTDPDSYSVYRGLTIDVQTTFSYQQYIFVVTTTGQLIVYDTTKSFTDPASYQIITALAGSTSLFKQFCVLSGTLYIGLANGQLISGNLAELIQGNTSSFVLNNYSPTTGTLTGTLVADFRYVYYAVSNTASSNVYIAKYDTSATFTNPSSYTSVDFTKTFSSNVNGVYQFISTGTELIMLPKGTPGKLYTYQFNANVQSQWYLLDYSAYGYQVTEGTLIGNTLYFVCDNFSILTYSNSVLAIFNLNLDFVSNNAKSFNGGKTWFSSSPSPSYSLAFGNGVLVSTGFSGVQGYSTDYGLSWNIVVPSLAGVWRSVAYGNGVFVMVGYGVQARSTDYGRSWTPVTYALVGDWSSVAYGNDIFVMVGNGVQARSTDYGLSWNLVMPSLAGQWTSVTYGNGFFVAVGVSSPYQARSLDFGQSWVAAATPFSGYGQWLGVAYGNGVFVATGSQLQAYSTTQGRTWVAATTSVGNYWFGIAYKNGIFAMSGYGQAYSTNLGVTWNLANHGVNSYGESLVSCDSRFIITGDCLRNLRAIGNYIYASTNNVAVQIDTTKDLSTASAYTFPAPVPIGQYIFANGPRYIYLFTQGSSQPIYRYDPYSRNESFKASIIADYETLPDGMTKPNKAMIPFVQTQRISNMTDLQLKGPVKEIWFTGQSGSNVYEYSNISSNCALTIHGEDLVRTDVGTPEFLKTIAPFETHTSMPDRNFSIVPFELLPESEMANGTINFSRIPDQVFTGGASNAWARTVNTLVIQNGLGGLWFNSQL